MSRAEVLSMSIRPQSTYEFKERKHSVDTVVQNTIFQFDGDGATLTQIRKDLGRNYPNLQDKIQELVDKGFVVQKGKRYYDPIYLEAKE